MNDRDKRGGDIRWLRFFHRVFMASVILVILMAWYSIYMHVVYPVAQDPKEERFQVASEERGHVKPLPGYMIENIGPDELEVLKP